MHSRLEKIFKSVIHASQWLQAIIYAGLVVGAAGFTIHFLMELVHFFRGFGESNNHEVILAILGLVDLSLVANLLVIVIISGYSSYVAPLLLDDDVARPKWMDQLDAGKIKIKLVTSFIAISAIHLLEIFFYIDERIDESLKWQLVIHVIFLVTALALAGVEKVSRSS